MDKLMDAYEYYRENGGAIRSFNEWLDNVQHTAYCLDEENIVFENNDADLTYMDGYYNALCEDIEIRFKNNTDKKKIKRTKEAVDRYHAYKAKCKAKGKQPLSFEAWAEKQLEANDMKKEMKRAGIKIAGAAALPVAVAAGKVAAKKIKQKNGIKDEDKPKLKSVTAKASFK